MSHNPIDFNTLTEKELKPTTKAVLDAIRNSDNIDPRKVNYVVQQDTKSGTEYVVIWI